MYVKDSCSVVKDDGFLNKSMKARVPLLVAHTMYRITYGKLVDGLYPQTIFGGYRGTLVLAYARSYQATDTKVLLVQTPRKVTAQGLQ